MKKISKIISALLCLFLLAGCLEYPINDEQYKKQVYLVGAVDELQTKVIKFTAEEAEETYIAAATGGSLRIDEDVKVTIAEDDEAIERYNKKYITGNKPLYHKLLPTQYSVPTMGCVIKAGDIYARIPLKIRAKELHCDSLYMLSFKIASASCEISKPDTTLLVTFKMENEYSGSYKMAMNKIELKDGLPVGKPSLVNSIRMLKAIDENTVRLFNLADIEENKNIAASCLSLTVNPQDYTVEIKAWDKLNLLGGSGVYDPLKKVYSVSYQYNSGDQIFQVTGTITVNEEVK